MHIFLLLTLLTLSCSATAMDLVPGQMIKWHTREYKVTERVEENDKITIVMARSAHKLGTMPLLTEYITRTYKHGNNEPESTIGTHAVTPESIISLSLVVLLAARALAPM